MSAPKNPFKAALLADTPQIGCWLNMAEPYLAEITAYTGFDWLVVDGEHGPNDIRSIRDQLMVIDPSPSHPVVRLPMGEAWMIKQALDIGARSLLIPMVESADQARALVRATRYPPEGIRGLGASLARASKFAAIANYPQTANAEICLIVQIETRKGMAALDEILAVDGVDGVFIGPADLSADMGFTGQGNVDEVWDVILDALTRIRAAGKAAGTLSWDDKRIAESQAAGANFVAVGADVSSLANSLRALVAKHKSR